MKLDKIRKLILEEKGVKLINSARGTQYIGGNHWMVQVDSGLRLTVESIKGLFDLGVEQMEKLQIIEMPLEGCRLWPLESRNNNKMSMGPLNIDNYGGVEMLIFGDAVYLLEQKYIRCAIAREDYKEFYLGWNGLDQPMIIINDGMIFAGIAEPMNRDVCKMLLEQMAHICELTPSGSRPPQEGGPLKLEPEGGMQLNMDDFREAGGE